MEYKESVIGEIEGKLSEKVDQNVKLLERCSIGCFFNFNNHHQTLYFILEANHRKGLEKDLELMREQLFENAALLASPDLSRAGSFRSLFFKQSFI